MKKYWVVAKLWPSKVKKQCKKMLPADFSVVSCMTLNSLSIHKTSSYWSATSCTHCVREICCPRVLGRVKWIHFYLRFKRELWSCWEKRCKRETRDPASLATEVRDHTVFKSNLPYLGIVPLILDKMSWKWRIVNWVKWSHIFYIFTVMWLNPGLWLVNIGHMVVKMTQMP